MSTLWLFALLTALPAAGPLVIAHRGGMAHRPENTMAAYEHALRLGVDVIEFDMGVCRSPSATPGPIRALTLKQLLTFDCGSHRLARFPGQQLSPGARMPTLGGFLARMARERVRLLRERSS